MSPNMSALRDAVFYAALLLSLMVGVSDGLVGMMLGIVGLMVVGKYWGGGR